MVVGLLREHADLLKGVGVDALLDLILHFLRPLRHLVDSFGIGEPSCKEVLVNHFLINLHAQNGVDLITMEERDFPNLVGKELGKVFKIRGFITLDIVQRHQWTFLLVREFVDEDLIEDVVHWRHLTWLSLYVLVQKLAELALIVRLGVQVLVIDDVDEVNYDVLQSHLIEPVDGLVVLGAGAPGRIRAHLLLDVAHGIHGQPHFAVLLRFELLLLWTLLLLDVR